MDLSIMYFNDQNYIVPSTSSIQFCFSKTDFMHNGTPRFVEKSFYFLNTHKLVNEGCEFFLMPSKLSSLTNFKKQFVELFRTLKYKVIHISEKDDILLQNGYYKKLKILNDILKRLKTDKVVVHANFFQNNRRLKREIFLNVLDDVQIIVENNGFDNEWGSNIDNILDIFSDCPEFKFCLDIAHVKDLKQYSLDDFINNEQLLNKLTEIHYSYSTRFCTKDPYKDVGFHGYAPFHALFSILKLKPSKKTKKFIRKYPIVMEGLVPKEDKELQYLKKEMEILKE